MWAGRPKIRCSILGTDKFPDRIHVFWDFMMRRWMFPDASKEISSTWNTWPLKMKALVGSKRLHSPKETSHPRKYEFSKTPLLEPQTYHYPDRLWGPPRLLVQWAPGMRRDNLSFAARGWETETYLCCLCTLWIWRNNTHALINIVIRLQSRTNSFRIWHMGICISKLQNIFC